MTSSQALRAELDVHLEKGRLEYVELEPKPSYLARYGK